jgi:hypothetical protein
MTRSAHIVTFLCTSESDVMLSKKRYDKNKFVLLVP